ncbi:glyoxalase family protein [Listeria floridensis FSL S10-1187]|uniref:Glyoxalase family protein n=1 Tax=Listeria floridensis FSL S10-1187 TaxID=1265817 RepID=A0ABN0RD17_9LIST|nr:VOC family protein [Listeria floridensis]EUJ28493.1 glyoxalase family protein [Listeria floridensis FSL S10-1187]
MARRSEMIFVNLPVQDLDKTVEFFTALGFEFNPKYTDENATCMIVSDHIFVMLLVQDFMKQFTKKPIGNFQNETSAILTLLAASREEVDEIYSKAIAAGASEAVPPMDQYGMYNRSFYDINGHLFEILYMEES